MYAALGLADGSEHVVEFLLPREQQGNTVVVAEANVALAQGLNNQRVARLSFCIMSNE
jgi:hypothetical protein